MIGNDILDVIGKTLMALMMFLAGVMVEHNYKIGKIFGWEYEGD